MPRSLFELTGVWTKTVTAAEYRSFLKTLFRRVVRRSPAGVCVVMPAEQVQSFRTHASGHSQHDMADDGDDRTQHEPRAHALVAVHHRLGEH